MKSSNCSGNMFNLYLLTLIGIVWSAYPNCDKKSTSSTIKSNSEYQTKLYLGCAFRFGEIARFKNNRSDENVTIKCSSRNETLKEDSLSPGFTFIIDVYKEPLESLDWKCSVNDSYNQRITFKPFDAYKNHQNFNFLIKDAGIYDISPRLVSMWN